MGGGFELGWKRMIISFLVSVLRVHGWGKEGHYAICKIAENFFTEDTLVAVKSLLPERAEGDLASVCSWADEVRRHPHYRWSSHLHYVNTPDFACNYEYARDCHKDRCVTGAIYNYTMQLMSGRNDDSDLTAIKYNLTEALMFLSHFVGDVHQPLHVGFKGDEGGNTIIVRWYRRKTNLHHVWDDNIIESAIKKFYNSELSTMIQSIQINITDEYFDDESSWQNCNETVCPDTLSTIHLPPHLHLPRNLVFVCLYAIFLISLHMNVSLLLSYASESINLACKFAYRNATPGSTLEDEYFLSRLPVVETRLAQSGVRLAAILNRIFSSSAHILVAKE